MFEVAVVHRNGRRASRWSDGCRKQTSITSSEDGMPRRTLSSSDPKKLLEQVEQLHDDGPPDFPFEQVLRIMGDSAANGDNADPVVFQGNSLAVVKQWVEYFGFDRLPETYGEVMGMVDRALSFDTLSSRRMPAHLGETWQRATLATVEENTPELLEPLKLFIAGDIEKLRDYHRVHDTLRRIGKEFKEFSVEWDTSDNSESEGSRSR